MFQVNAHRGEHGEGEIGFLFDDFPKAVLAHENDLAGIDRDCVGGVVLDCRERGFGKAFDWFEEP